MIIIRTKKLDLLTGFVQLLFGIKMEKALFYMALDFIYYSPT